MEFYYQIKGKVNPDVDNIGFYGSNQNWVFPPIFSGKIDAIDKQSAKLMIDELYGKKFPLRVLQKDLDSNEYLLSIEEIKPNSHIQRLFEQRSCKQCNNMFYVIDKYNDANNKDKGFDFCSEDCHNEYRQLEYYKRNEDYNMNGIHKPVIYKITNRINNKVYIGKTTQAFTLRWYQHFFQGTDCEFHTCIKNSNVTDWIFEVQEIIIVPNEISSLKDIDNYITERERFWINHYDSINNGYNSKI